MPTALRALVLIVVVAVATHVALLLAIPRLVMAEVVRIAAVRSGGVNRLDFAPRVTDANQIVVRASPDFLYASCSYDLSAGPLAIATPMVPGTHSVVALFSDNMDNFFVAGDWRGETLSVVLALAGTRPATRLPVVTSPSVRGLALVRVFVNDETQAGLIDAARRSAMCGPFAGPAEPPPTGAR
jgi:uncharacterized membrane protein